MRPAEILLVAALALPAASAAEAASPRHRLDLPAGRLADALVALGRQAGVSVGVTDPALANRRVGAVRGTLTVDEALRRLLRGTGARFVAVDGLAWRIVAGPPPRAPRLRPVPARPRPSPPPPSMPPPESEAPAIVVTAAKRPTRLAAFPGAVEIVGGDDPALADAPGGSEALVARLPGLTSTHLGPGRNKLFIRGIADSSFTGPTQSTVGQYLGETRLNYNAPDPDLRLFDLERVEVLAGPQGTLYGSGSLGGIVRLVPNPAALDGAAARLLLGGAATQHGEPGGDAALMVNLPLAEGRAAIRLAAYAEREGGYIDDLRRGLDDVNRTRVEGGRLTFRIRPDAAWTVDFGLTGQRIRGDDAQYADADAAPLTRMSAVRENYGSDYGLTDLVVTREWGLWRLVSAVGAVRHSLTERYEWDRSAPAPLVLQQSTRTSFLSFETRLSRGRGGGGGWLIGTSLIRNRAEQSRGLGPPGAPQPLADVTNEIAEGAVFGEAGFRLAPRLTAAAGARVSLSRIAASSDEHGPIAFGDGPDAAIAADRTGTAFLPSASLGWRAAPDLLLFARYQQAFRPGGVALAGNDVRRFRADRIAALEAGARYGRADLDASASFSVTRWRNVQADIIDSVGNPTTANIGDGRIYTIDLRLGWRPVEGVEIDAGAVLNDSQLINAAFGIDIAPDGPLPNVAGLNARLGAAWRREATAIGDLRLSASARYVGKSRLGGGGVLGQEQGGWLDVGGGARAELGRHAFTLALTNLLDTSGNRFALGSPYTISEQGHVTPLRPRSLRAGWELRF